MGDHKKTTNASAAQFKVASVAFGEKTFCVPAHFTQLNAADDAIKIAFFGNWHSHKEPHLGHNRGVSRVQRSFSTKTR